MVADAAPVSADRWALMLLVLAALWSAGLVAAAGLVRVYSSTSGGSATLVHVNGARVLVPIGLPLLAVGVVAVARWLRRRGAAPRAGAGVVSWTVTVLVGATALLGMLTIGPYLLPTAALLTAVCARS